MAQRRTRPYNPKANGCCERAAGAIAGVLAKLVRDFKAEWGCKPPAALMAMSTTRNVSAGYAPLALLTGRDFLTPIHVEMGGVPDIDQAITEQGGLKEGNRIAD